MKTSEDTSGHDITPLKQSLVSKKVDETSDRDTTNSPVNHKITRSQNHRKILVYIVRRSNMQSRKN